MLKLYYCMHTVHQEKTQNIIKKIVNLFLNKL